MLISSVTNTEQALAKDEALNRTIREKEKAWKTANDSGQSQGKRGPQGQRRGKGPQKANNPIAENAVSAAAALAATASAQTYTPVQQDHQSTKPSRGQKQTEMGASQREESNFTYDESTGLYYDPKSTYYYNSVSGRYCYYDAQQQAYIGVDEAGNTTGPEVLPIGNMAAPESQGLVLHTAV
jgi:hypothetical protein